MEKFATDKLVAYVVWLPQLNYQDPARLQKKVRRYAELLPAGPRVTYYSDPQAYVGKKYGAVIKVPYGAPAWDVYFAFAADVRWGDSPPPPTYWEQQMGGFPAETRLDGPRFAEQVRKLLGNSQAPGQSQPASPPSRRVAPGDKGR